MAEEKKDKSGSCAIMALVVDSDCYICNVGDSRAFVSSNDGKNIEFETSDHKPKEE